jgi:hypothetical protein
MASQTQTSQGRIRVDGQEDRRWRSSLRHGLRSSSALCHDILDFAARVLATVAGQIPRIPVTRLLFEPQVAS